MSFSNYWIDESKEKLGIKTDKEISENTKMSKADISNIRAGRRSLSKNQAIEIAKVLKIDSGIVLAGVMADKATDKEEKEAWKNLIKIAYPDLYKKIQGKIKYILC